MRGDAEGPPGIQRSADELIGREHVPCLALKLYTSIDEREFIGHQERLAVLFPRCERGLPGSDDACPGSALQEPDALLQLVRSGRAPEGVPVHRTHALSIIV